MSGEITLYRKSGSLLKNHLPHERENFIVALRKVATAHGITNITVDMIDYAEAFIYRHFGGAFTQFEIVYAFELYALGKLAVVGKKEWAANFNIEFIAAVLNAYIDYRRPVIESEEKIAASHQLAEHVEKITYEEHCAMMDKILTDFITSERKMPVAGDFEAAYDHLERTGKIVMSNDEKFNYREEVRDRLYKVYAHEQYMHRLSPYEFRDKMTALDDNKKFAKTCREERAKDYYKELLIEIQTSNPNQNEK